MPTALPLLKALPQRLAAANWWLCDIYQGIYVLFSRSGRCAELSVTRPSALLSLKTEELKENLHDNGRSRTFTLMVKHLCFATLCNVRDTDATFKDISVFTWCVVHYTPNGSSSYTAWCVASSWWLG